MGFFAEIASEARRNLSNKQEPAPAQKADTKPQPINQESVPDPLIAVPEAPPTQSASTSVEETTVASADSEQKPVAAYEPPTIDLTAKADAEDEAQRKQAHEAAEAKRKAEFDAKQAAKKAAQQEQLAKLAAMSDADILAASVSRVASDTEKLTRRNMKEAVAEHVQTKCREDVAFARLVMTPTKSMINCFQYINRRAREYAEQEMKDNGIERTGVYGCDVPDGLCYQWAEDYFNDPNAKEDHKNDEKFVPKPYVPNHKTPKGKGKTAKAKSDTKKPVTETPKAPAMEQMQLSFA